MSEALIMEIIMTLVTMGMAHHDAKQITEDEIDEAIKEAVRKFKLRKAEDLPDV